jgi:hypothetical protein
VYGKLREMRDTQKNKKKHAEDLRHAPQATKGTHGVRSWSQMAVCGDTKVEDTEIDAVELKKFDQQHTQVRFFGGYRAGLR